MNSFDICLKEADIAYMEACNVASIFSDACEIEMYTEEAQSESILQKCKKKIKTLLDKVVKAIQTFCTSNKLKNDIQKMEDTSQNELNKMKCEILDENKKKSFIKKYSDRIKNAKSADEVNAIMDEYRKKKKITKFTVIVSGVALLGILRQINVHKKTNEANKAFDDYAKTVDEFESELNKLKSSEEKFSEYPEMNNVIKQTKVYGLESKIVKSHNKLNKSDIYRAHRSKHDKKNIKYNYSDIRKIDEKISALTEIEADYLGVDKDVTGSLYNIVSHMTETAEEYHNSFKK